MATHYDYLLKLIVIGDSGVGKSCMVLQFVEGRFQETYDVTIGVEFASKNVQIDEKIVKLQIWDTAGQQNFRSITRSYYHNAIGALLLYDITRKQTFDHIKDWLQQTKYNGNETLQVILIGNKKDLDQERQVSFKQGEQLAEKQGMKFIETSAKNNEDAEFSFNELVYTIINKCESGKIPMNAAGLKVSEQIRLKKVQQQKRKCC